MTVEKVYNMLKELKCATAVEIAERLGMTRKTVQMYLSRLAARDLVEKRVLGRRAVMYCVKEGGEGASHKPGDSSLAATEVRRTERDGGGAYRLFKATRRRMAQVLELLQRDGCISVGTLMRALGVTHTRAYYMSRVLLLLRKGVKVTIGNTAVLCRDRAAAEETIARLRETIHRLAVENGMRYVTPTKILQVALRDRDAYKLLSRFVPLSRGMERFPPALLKFVDDVLRTLYGEPLKLRRKTVYVVSPQPRGDYTVNVTDSVDKHVVRVNLPDDLATALQGVAVEDLTLQAIEQLLQRYRP